MLQIQEWATWRQTNKTKVHELYKALWYAGWKLYMYNTPINLWKNARQSKEKKTLLYVNASTHQKQRVHTWYFDCCSLTSQTQLQDPHQQYTEGRRCTVTTVHADLNYSTLNTRQGIVELKLTEALENLMTRKFKEQDSSHRWFLR